MVEAEDKAYPKTTTGLDYNYATFMITFTPTLMIKEK